MEKRIRSQIPHLEFARRLNGGHALSVETVMANPAANTNRGQCS